MKLKMMFVRNYVLLSLSLVLNNFDTVFAGTDGNLRAAADLKHRRRIEDQACLSVGKSYFESKSKSKSKTKTTMVLTEWYIILFYI